MFARLTANRGVVGLINAAPAAAAARFGTSARLSRALRPVVNALLPTAPTVIAVRAGTARGVRLRIHPRHEKFYWTGLYEMSVQETFVRLLRPGMTVWDVGAHIGFLTAIAARRVRPGGRVHAFEPLASNRMRLLETVELNKLREVEVHSDAVAHRPGIKQLYGHSSTSMWSLIERTDSPQVDVRCVTLDDLLTEGSFGNPALVKIDAEGAELDILRGGLRLATETGAILIVEFTDEDVLEEARSSLPGHEFEALSARHWLLRRRPDRGDLVNAHRSSAGPDRHRYL